MRAWALLACLVACGRLHFASEDAGGIVAVTSTTTDTSGDGGVLDSVAATFTHVNTIRDAPPR